MKKVSLCLGLALSVVLVAVFAMDRPARRRRVFDSASVPVEDMRSRAPRGWGSAASTASTVSAASAPARIASSRPEVRYAQEIKRTKKFTIDKRFTIDKVPKEHWAKTARQYFFMTGNYLDTGEIEYWFSIEELLRYRKMPKVKLNKEELYELNLFDMKIASLKGLAGLRGAQRVQKLVLAKNGLTAAGLEELETLKNLQVLDLKNNRIASFKKGCFESMEHLSRLEVTGNPIGWFACMTLQLMARRRDITVVF